MVNRSLNSGAFALAREATCVKRDLRDAIGSEEVLSSVAKTCRVDGVSTAGAEPAVTDVPAQAQKSSKKPKTKDTSGKALALRS
eukprot:1795458-Prymnesium_polylepis.3